MYLKKLELSGFKSFAKHTTLEFPTAVTAIVGPNGSGKSNVSEALRWVLGEQSMKSLRGKKGEDLIFHGSNSASQLSKAVVKLTFENAARTLPVDFDEVVISREVYRDGMNEYKLNGSVVRLKDIIELLSHVGIGGSGHHIISQGEADRILYANAKERRVMLEDALGLKIFQIKRAEAERKLSSTEENMKQIASLRREIQPHLRFLKTQADKIEASATIREELKKYIVEYLIKENNTILADEHVLQEKRKPLEQKQQALEQEIQQAWAKISEADQPDEGNNGIADELSKVSTELRQKEEEARSLERELGRLEGQLSYLESISKKQQASGSVPRDEVETAFRSVLHSIDEIVELDSFEHVKAMLLDIRQRVQEFMGRVSEREASASQYEAENAELHKKIHDIKNTITGVGLERELYARKRDELEAALSESRRKIRASERIIREQEQVLNQVKDALRSSEVEKERIRLRREEFEWEVKDADRFVDEFPDTSNDTRLFTDHERENLQRTMERLKIKLDEVGNIDASLLREYKEVSERDAFLGRELEDLEKTSRSLRELMDELEDRLEEDFVQGVKKINSEFNELFTGMFGGGSAELKLVKYEHSDDEEKDKEDVSAVASAEVEAGLEISVDLPRKKVKNLDMLSGGERALTSIALLFAMSSVNPPPFLVLDETDAALDEANSQRYGAMLKNLSKKTQLIVITHNRQTMKEAGVLYGITMSSDGISRLISLKFEEATEIASR